MNISEKREFCLEEIEVQKKLLKLLDELGAAPDDIKVNTNSTLTLEVHSMKELHYVRRWLRGVLKWEDKLGVIFYSQGEMLATFQGVHHDITIWLSTLPEEFPKELQSENCRVMKIESRTVEEYAYVCEEGE